MPFLAAKDSVYAASLFAEMVSVTGMSPCQIVALLESKYGVYRMVEDNLSFAPAEKTRIVNILMKEKKLPDFGKKILRVNYEDGCKVYFTDGSFVICRFSGTEPLLRIFAESSTVAAARQDILSFKSFLDL